MDEKEEKFGTLRLKYRTLAELKRLKLSTENSVGHELTNDEFISMLIKIAIEGK